MHQSEESSMRMHKPGFKDPKLIVGLILILISIAGVIGIIRINNQTYTYYTAKNDISIGQKITPDMLIEKQVNLGDSKDRYLSREQLESGKYIAVRQIPAGELISSASAHENIQERRRLVTVTLDRGIASALKAGERVDIWVISSGKEKQKVPEGEGKNEDNESEQKPLVQNAEISTIAVDEGVLGANGHANVQLWIESEKLPDILHAMSSETKITLVPIEYKSEGN